MQKAILNPYFARIDFKEDNKKHINNLYVGKTTIYNNDSKHEIAVVDWRAPISSMYYDCSIGIASYVCPEGVIIGELTLKRHIKLKIELLCYRGK